MAVSRLSRLSAPPARLTPEALTVQLDARGATSDDLLRAIDAAIQPARAETPRWRITLVDQLAPRLPSAEVQSVLTHWGVAMLGPLVPLSPAERVDRAYADVRVPVAALVLWGLNRPLPYPETTRLRPTVATLVSTLRPTAVMALALALQALGDSTTASVALGMTQPGGLPHMAYHPAASATDRQMALGALRYAHRLSLPEISLVPGVLADAHTVHALLHCHVGRLDGEDLERLLGAIPVDAYQALVKTHSRVGHYPALARVLMYGPPTSRATLRPTRRQLTTWLEVLPPDCRSVVLGLMTHVRPHR
jgi:hypothetical protein